MSHSCDEYYTLYNETSRRARKPHACDACRETIPPRAVYWRVFTVFDGDATLYVRCSRCQAIHLHLREKCAASGSDMWPDERLACGLKYEDEWGELPEEIEALAFALPGDSIAQVSR